MGFFPIEKCKSGNQVVPRERTRKTGEICSDLVNEHNGGRLLSGQSKQLVHKLLTLSQPFRDLQCRETYVFCLVAKRKCFIPGCWSQYFNVVDLEQRSWEKTVLSLWCRACSDLDLNDRPELRVHKLAML